MLFVEDVLDDRVWLPSIFCFEGVFSLSSFFSRQTLTNERTDLQYLYTELYSRNILLKVDLLELVRLFAVRWLLL